MWELTNSLLALRDPSSAALHLPFLRTISGRLGGLELRPAVELVPGGGYQPDFISPPPSGPLGEIEDELTRVRATPAERVRREMTIFAREHSAHEVARPWLQNPRRMVTRFTDTLAAYWSRGLEPSWARIRALLEADLAYRSQRLTRGGPAALFADLHPNVRLKGGRLEVDMLFDETVALEGRGLLLMPSVFTWLGPLAVTDPAWQPTVVYPARGLATLWQEGRAAPSGGLARVLGSTRATLLAELDAPRTTTELARRVGISAGAVSQHLSALHDARLVSRERAGREVLYARTPVADQLVAPD